MSQKEQVMEYLRTHPEGITMMEAFHVLKITKLNTRVSELIAEGKKIEKKWESHKNEYGRIVRYIRYFLVEA